MRIEPSGLIPIAIEAREGDPASHLDGVNGSDSEDMLRTSRQGVMMRISPQRILWGIVIALASSIGVIGCSDGPRLVPVEGVVTFNGEPLEGANLTFIPDPSNPVQTQGEDVTGLDGSFSAKYRHRRGLAPGKYKLVATKLAATEKAEQLPDEIQGDALQLTKMAGMTKNTLPDIYSDLGKTEITLEVSESGEKGLVFDLKGRVDE